MKKLLPKLEEEKCRRKHCEKLIQELQMKILEMQQRLAVACQVDSAKDEAILRFHEAWEKVAHRWQSLETERNTLSKKLFTVEEKANAEVLNATQKVTQCEIELSKALDMAHKCQEKCKKLELERSELLSQLSDLRTEVKTTRANLEDIAKERDQLAERILCLEKESLKGKQLLLETQKEVTHSKNVFQICQNELTGLSEEHVKLQKRIKEEQSIILQLETQKKTLHHSLDSSKKAESTLQLELRNLQEESERNKIELRNFYQQQVEVLVKDKLKEFQDQLEQAEKSLQDELRNKEHVITRSAAKQLQKLTDKHRLEVQLIEEKHKEEVRLYELQFAHMKEQISLLQNKLESQHAKRVNIAQELHTVMETQWREALRIIDSGKSPAPGTPQSTELQRTVSDESNRPFTIQDLKKFLSKHEIKSSEAIGVPEQGIGDNNSVNFRGTNSSKDQTPFLMSNELLGNMGTFTTPVSSKSQIQFDQQSETDLKKYIKLLMEKSTRQTTEKPLENVKMPVSQESSSSDFADMSSWQQLLVPKMNDKSSAAPSKEYRTEKPPWK
ncbi:Centrobin [Carabus blaptoides fortunei]